MDGQAMNIRLLQRLPEVKFGESSRDYVLRVKEEWAQSGEPLMELMETSRLKYQQDSVREMVETLKTAEFSTTLFKQTMRDAVVMLLQRAFHL
jgi:hypothetical protein